uniref:Putative mRNA-capping enzyme n=1 Tax=Anthurium amnicola TaxID=1678845 RepID=A0A1D1XM78_9ARAE
MANADTELFYPPIRRKASHRALGDLPTRSHPGVFFSLETLGEEEPGRGSLDACFLCERPLLASSDVFMYQGNMPFCSMECRQEQIELDEARQREINYRRRRHHHPAAHAKQLPPSDEHSLYARASDGVVAG